MYKVTITNNSDVTQKIYVNINVEENTFENYYLQVFRGNNITESTKMADPMHFIKDELNTITPTNMIITLIPSQSVVYNLVYYVKNLDELQDDENKKFVSNISLNTEVTGTYDKDEITVELGSSMVPIKYNETEEKWVITTIDDFDWYDYQTQKWANSAILKNSSDNVVGNTLILPEPDNANTNVYAMFVYIPRYSYTFGCQGNEISQNACLGYKIDGANDLSLATPGAIDIKFVSKDTFDMYTGERPAYTYVSGETRTPSNWYTHPAFWWDDNNNGIREKTEELSGIWVGKFETTGNNNIPTILPNTMALVYQKISLQFSTARKFYDNNNLYGIDKTKLDVHMMKNSEWGVVTYLSQSKYGKYGNSEYINEQKELYVNNSSSHYTGRSGGNIGGNTKINETYLTETSNAKYNNYGFYTYDDYLLEYGVNKKQEKIVGKGSGASTTGNIYGIYDMSGGNYEYVMGNFQNSLGTSGFNSNWLNNMENIKYFDKYTQKNMTTLSREILGHSAYETKGWYNDNYADLTLNSSWIDRGGDYGQDKSGGIFYSRTDLGGPWNNVSFRITASPLNT